MKKFTIYFTNLFLLSVLCLTSVFSNELPDEYYSFRDDMYNFKDISALESEYQSCCKAANEKYTGYDLYLSLARYEYIMGRAYYYLKQNDKAGIHYDLGMDYAQKAIKEKNTAQSQLIYAENISANCTVKPTSWVISNGAKIAGLAKKVISMDKKNAAATYMLNAQDVYAPAPFNNHKRGIKNMNAMLQNATLEFGTDDEFNTKSAIGYAYIQLGDKENAKLWLKKSLEIYPNNQYVQGLLADLDK